MRLISGQGTRAALAGACGTISGTDATKMSLDAKVQKRLRKALAVVDEHGTTGPRLLDDAARLIARIRHFTSMKLVAEGVDLDALELACYAIQLQSRRPRPAPPGRGGAGRISLKEKAEEAAELLLEIGLDVDDDFLDRTTRILHEMPHRSPMLDEAKLLADAVNLDDFGATGLVQQIIHAARNGEGVVLIADGLQKREQYGYWDARLKDGFHFEPVRQIARRRLDNARHVALLLAAELKEDGA